MPALTRLIPLLLLIACASSPTAQLAVSPLTDLPAPGKLQEIVSKQAQRSVSNCYKTALGTQKGLKGTVTAKATGSHGILKVEISGENEKAPGPLDSCVKEAFADQKIQRELVDGDNLAGFSIVARFGE